MSTCWPSLDFLNRIEILDYYFSIERFKIEELIIKTNQIKILS